MPIKEFKKLTKAGNPPQCNLGQMYREGLGLIATSKKLLKCLIWLQKVEVVMPSIISG